MKRLWVGLATTVVVFGGLAGGYIVNQSGGGNVPGLANLWVNVSAGGTPSRCAVQCAFDSTHAYGTVNAATAASSQGDVIRVVCGSYPAQTINRVAAMDTYSVNVVVDSATGDVGCAKTHDLQINTSHITIRHLQRDDSSTCTSTGWSYSANVYVPPSCDSIAINSGACSILDNVGVVVDAVDYAYFSATSSQFTVTNSNFGPSWDNHGLIHSKTATGGSPCPTRPAVVWTNNVVRDHLNTPEYLAFCPNNPGSPGNPGPPAGTGLGCPAGTQHQGCGPTLNDVSSFAGDRDKWTNCQDTGILIKDGAAGTNDNVTISNSYFGPSNGGTCPAACKIDINNDGLDQTNLKFINNTINATVSLGSTTGSLCTGCQFRGNIFDAVSGTFGAPWTAQYNWTDNAFTCTGTCSNNTTNFVFASNLGSDGLHLLTSAPVKGALPVQSWTPPVDYDGDTRSDPTSPGADQGATATTGASQATCTGGTCTPGTQPDNSPANNFVTLPSCEPGGTCNFGYYVPTGLTGTAAVVFVAGGGGNCASYPNANWGGWPLVMDAHRYIGIELRCPIASAWDNDEDSFPPAESSASDTVYIAAVVNYVLLHTFNGVTPDPARLYFTGGSSGGHITRSVMCSQNTVGSFRAVAIVSAGAVTSNGGSVGSCFYQTDKSLFAMYMGGTSVSDPFTTTVLSGHDILGFTPTIAWQASYFTCNASPAVTPGTINGHTITTNDYTGCGFGTSPQFRSVFLSSGGHSYPGLDTSACGTTTCGWAAAQSAAFFDATTG